MNKQTTSIILLIFMLLAHSCSDENLNNIAANQFVVEAFLFAREPIDDIKIKSTFPLTDAEDSSSPINNAEVALVKNGVRYTLESLNNDGEYGYVGNDLEVIEGDIFQLEVMYNGILATAETIVPSPTTGLSLNPTKIVIPRIGLGGLTNPDQIRTILENANIEIDWNNPNEDLYYAVIQSLDEEIDPIFPAVVQDRFRQFQFVSEPTRDSNILFRAIQLESYGVYSVKVYHINDEYAALYENQEQDSRDLNEPPSNINNALGVFSAFSSQEEFFEVSRM